MEKSKTGQPDIVTEPLQVIMINSTGMMKTLGTDKELLDMYKMLNSSLKSMKVCFLLTDVENAMIGFSSGDLLKQVREDKNIIVFEDIKNIKVTDVPIGAAREFKKSLEAKDAYIFVKDKIEKVRVIEGR